MTDKALCAVVVERAYAKINLSLDVLGIRPDGYHDLRSVMQTISLHDTLTFQLGTSYITDGDAHPSDFALIDKAIAATCEAAGFEGHISYDIDKRIPVAAGLGGGSADAVAAIRGTCRLIAATRDHGDSEGGMVDLGLDLHAIAESLGSDVPYFLTGGTALVEGRGERVTPLDHAEEKRFVLVGTDLPVSTAAVFQELGDADWGDGHATDRVLDALKEGRVIFGGNDLTAAALRRFPGIREAFGVFGTGEPSDSIAMSGSGGTIVGCYETESEAEEAVATARKRMRWAITGESRRRDEPAFKG